MEPFSAFLFIIKTNFEQIIASFVDSKFESTRTMECKINCEKYTRTKLINNSIIYYFLDQNIIRCDWKHKQ